MNQKRQRISEVIMRTGLITIKDIAKATSCHVSTVKATMAQLQVRGCLAEYQYNNEHSQTIHDQIKNCIADPSNRYFSASDIKRKIPPCSKKFIRKKLKQAGLRYLRLKRERMSGDPRRFDKTELQSVIWTAVQAMAKNQETILFLDEAEFPLVNTSDYCWSKPDELPLYNRRPTAGSLYVIALCSQE